ADLPRRCETKRGQEDRRSGTSSTATETDDASRRAQTCPAGARPSEARRIEGAVHQVPRLRPTTHRAGRSPAGATCWVEASCGDKASPPCNPSENASSVLRDPGWRER